MKKKTILLILYLAFSYVNAQTILVNSNVISVQEDVTFPLWLDSMSTIETGTQVISISALEFNIVPNSNGNSLVFSQTKTITSQETVPNGMTWKITAVLLDSTATNNSSSNGGGQVIVSGSGGNMPVALSEESAITMTMGESMIHCDSLQEDGYDNWVVPTWEELMFVASGGGIVPGTRTSNYLFTSDRSHATQNSIQRVRLSDGALASGSGYDIAYIRCVRHESISVSGSGSSSGGSNSTSGGGGGNVAVALSNESASTMTFQNSILYCDNLNESGYTDWVMPTLNEMTFISSGGCVIPDTRTEEYIWTRSIITSGSDYEYVYKIRLQNTSAPNSGQDVITASRTYNSQLNKARCVRHGSISVSNSGSSSGGSNTASTLGSGMPTMISTEATIGPMSWGAAALYCNSLNESGYSDWIMPTLKQLTYASTGGCVIPDARTNNWIWTRSEFSQEEFYVFQLLTPSFGSGGKQLSTQYPQNSVSEYAHCRCVR